MRLRRQYFGKLLASLAIASSLGIMASCSSGPGPASSSTGTHPSGGPTTSGPPVTVNLVAQDLSFDMKTIVVPPGASVTINFTNKDSGIMHNFALYNDSTAKTSIFVGKLVTGPGTAVYTFTAPTKVGDYFFRCDVHPTQMTGTFIVE
jgi:plastocyanin